MQLAGLTELEPEPERQFQQLVIGIQGSRSVRPRRAALTLTLTATLLSVALTGCGGSGTTKPDSTATSSAAAKQEGSGPADTNGGPVVVDQQTAAQIQGTVNDAQSELDGLDQDFAGDDAAAN